MIPPRTAVAAAVALCMLLLGLHPGVASSAVFHSTRQRKAYVALQAWKRTAVFSDPSNLTGNWISPDVCTYNGVFCAPTLGDHVVAGINLSHADIEGYLPPSLPLGLTDVVLFNVNSNRFSGVVPDTFRHLSLLHELDLGNNNFVGKFPDAVLRMPSLKRLDISVNHFEGSTSTPRALFDRRLAAVAHDSNRLRSPIPSNLGNRPAAAVLIGHGGHRMAPPTPMASPPRNDYAGGNAPLSRSRAPARRTTRSTPPSPPRGSMTPSYRSSSSGQLAAPLHTEHPDYTLPSPAFGSPSSPTSYSATRLAPGFHLPTTGTRLSHGGISTSASGGG